MCKQKEIRRIGNTKSETEIQKAASKQEMYCGHVETQTMQTANCADWVLFFYLYLNFLVKCLL